MRVHSFLFQCPSITAFPSHARRKLVRHMPAGCIAGLSLARTAQAVRGGTNGKQSASSVSAYNAKPIHLFFCTHGEKRFLVMRNGSRG